MAVALCALLLFGGFALKAQCLSPPGWDGRQYSHLCYNDIQALYEARGVSNNVFPYIGGALVNDQLTLGAIEYPVLTGMFMWLTGLFASDTDSYLKVSAVALAPFALLVALLLARMSARRALLWSLAPAIVLYAFHNWDLLAVAAAVVGLWLWWRGMPLWAAVAFGVGAAFKMYPALFVLALALSLARAGRWGIAGKVAGAGAGTFALINLPFAIVNFEGWFLTYEFHSNRTGNFDSIWTLGWPHAEAATLNLVTAGLTVAFVVLACIYAWRRLEPDEMFLPLCGGLLAAFLLWNKVHSPQYTLWLLPFFVLLRVHLGWWIAYAIADLAVYVGVFRWFYDYVYLNDDFTLAKRVMIAGVWGRAALLLVLFALFLRARSAVDRPSETFSSHPLTTLRKVGDRLPAQS